MMSNGYVYLPLASSTESFDTSYSGSKEEMEVASTVQPFKEEPRESNKDFDQDWKRDKDDFLLAVLRSRLEQKAPVTKF